MKILALDLGSTVGCCYPLTYMDGLVTQSETFAGKRPVKLMNFKFWLREILAVRYYDLVIYERPFTRGLAATRFLWGMAGITDALATEYGAAVMDMPPTTMKKWATGSGKAEKEDMIAWAASIGYDSLNEHEADALALYRYALANVRTGDGKN